MLETADTTARTDTETHPDTAIHPTPSHPKEPGMRDKNNTKRGRGSGPPPFTLWREVLVAYLAPALMAGSGGLASGQSTLLVAAFTSIAGTSAVVATLIGTWLQRRGPRHRWLTSPPRIVPAALLAVGAAAVGGLVGWLVVTALPAHTGDWPSRLRIDLPISAALAASIMTWRWRGARRTARHSA